MISSIEEIAFRMGYIDSDQLLTLGNMQNKSTYGKYLVELATE